MLSRVANNLFWLDRYMERSYGLVKLIITNYNSTLDSGEYSSWNGILKTYMNIESLDDLNEYDDAISIIDFMLFDKINPNTLINIISKARENARGVQEHISKEVWLTSNKFYLHINDKSIHKKFRRLDPIVFLEDLLSYNLMYYSSSDLTQERGNAFGFMNLGKYYERTLQSVDFLSYRLNQLSKEEYLLQESVFWKNLLLSIGGYQIYLKTYKSIFNANNIIELISLNQFFPRSIRYSLSKFKIVNENGKLKFFDNLTNLTSNNKEIILYKIFQTQTNIKKYYLLTNMGILITDLLDDKNYEVTDLFLETTAGRLIFSFNFTNALKI